ncbi:MAG: hypothetical protein CL678_13260 [Bdellovibrionaceae bacterium]|nr:hypothetical protein [Pseudobdellovibrionaceae bacterium]
MKTLVFLSILFLTQAGHATKIMHHNACQAIFRTFDKVGWISREKTHGTISELSILRTQQFQGADATPKAHTLVLSSETASKNDKKRIASQLAGIESHYAMATTEETPDFKVQALRLVGDQEIENFIAQIEAFQNEFGEMIKRKKNRRRFFTTHNLFYALLFSGMRSLLLFTSLHQLRTNETVFFGILTLLISYVQLVSTSPEGYSLMHFQDNHITQNLRQSFETLKKQEGWKYLSHSFSFSRASRKKISEINSVDEMEDISWEESFFDFQVKLPFFEKIHEFGKDYLKEWVAFDSIMIKESGKPVELLLVLRSHSKKPQFPKKKEKKIKKTLIEQTQGVMGPVPVNGIR